MDRKCPSCFILHTPDKCPTSRIPAAHAAIHREWVKPDLSAIDRLMRAPLDCGPSSAVKCACGKIATCSTPIDFCCGSCAARQKCTVCGASATCVDILTLTHLRCDRHASEGQPAPPSKMAEVMHEVLAASPGLRAGMLQRIGINPGPKRPAHRKGLLQFRDSTPRKAGERFAIEVTVDRHFRGHTPLHGVEDMDHVLLTGFFIKNKSQIAPAAVPLSAFKPRVLDSGMNFDPAEPGDILRVELQTEKDVGGVDFFIEGDVAADPADTRAVIGVTRPTPSKSSLWDTCPGPPLTISGQVQFKDGPVEYEAPVFGAPAPESLAGAFHEAARQHAAQHPLPPKRVCQECQPPRELGVLEPVEHEAHEQKNDTLAAAVLEALKSPAALAALQAGPAFRAAVMKRVATARERAPTRRRAYKIDVGPCIVPAGGFMTVATRVSHRSECIKLLIDESAWRRPDGICPLEWGGEGAREEASGSFLIHDLLVGGKSIWKDTRRPQKAAEFNRTALSDVYFKIPAGGEIAFRVENIAREPRVWLAMLIIRNCD